MPKRNDEIMNSENIKIRLTLETRNRCYTARLLGAHKRETESSFMSFLIELGLAKYEKAILPLEMGEDEALVTVSAANREKNQGLKKEAAR